MNSIGAGLRIVGSVLVKGLVPGLFGAALIIPISSSLNVASASAAQSNAAVAVGSAVVPDSDFGNFTSLSFLGNDDGTYPCGGDGNAPAPCTGDETGPAAVPLGFKVNFDGSEYTSAYVNNNGNITFDAPLSTFTPFWLVGTSQVIIAPFFADVDTRVGNVVEIGTGTLDGHKAFVVDWPSVGCYEENDSVTNNFQLVLIDRPDLGTNPLAPIVHENS